jgi:hypothetical protein
MEGHILPEHESYYSVVRNYLTEVEHVFDLEKSNADA